MVCTIQGPGDDDNNYDDDTNDDDDGRPVYWHPVHHGRWPTQFSYSSSAQDVGWRPLLQSILGCQIQACESADARWYTIT